MSAFHASLSELELRIESFRSAGSLVGRGSRSDCTKTCWHRPVLVCGERLTAIDNLLKSLQLGSYQRFSKEWFWQRIIEYRFWVLGTLAAFALLLIHSFIVSRTVNIRTQELKESLKRESQSFHEAQEAHRRLMKMQRAAVVGQISSLIAHELNQPLAGIKLYARSFSAPRIQEH